MKAPAGGVLIVANQAFAIYRARMPLIRQISATGRTVHVLHPDVEKTEGSLPVAELETSLASTGVKRLDVPFRRTGINIGMLGSVLTFYRTVRRQGIELVHLFNPKCILMFGLPSRAVVGGERLHVTFTGLGLDESRRRRFRLWLYLYGLIVGRRASLHFETEHDRSAFFSVNRRHKNRSRVAIASGVDCARFGGGRSASHGRSVSVLFASRIIRNKGIFEYLEAASALGAKSDVSVQFVAAGDYELERTEGMTESEFVAAASASNVEYVGAVGFDELPDLLARTDVVVLPSYREGCPKILMEAAAAGCVPLATDLPGTRLVVEHGLSGLLFPRGDAAALTAGLRQLAENPDQMASFGEEARRHARRSFDQDRLALETLRFYDE